MSTEHISSPPSPTKMLIILLGASEWPHDPDRFPSYQAFKNAAAEIYQYFVGKVGIPQNRVLKLFDTDLNASNIDDEICNHLEKFKGDATDVIVYYVGHGKSTRSNQLYLAIKNTRSHNPEGTSLRVESLAQTMLAKARDLRRFYILDCCFASKAIPNLMGVSEVDLVSTTFDEVESTTFDKVEDESRGVTGIFSSGNSEASAVLPDDTNTFFTKALLELLSTGNPLLSKPLSFHDIYAEVDIYQRKLYRKYVSYPDAKKPSTPQIYPGNIGKIPILPNPAVSMPIVLHGCYRVERILVNGRLGPIYLSTDLGSNQLYVVKEYSDPNLSAMETFKQEATVLKGLRHPNLPTFQDVFFEHERPCLVLSYVEGSDLTDILRSAYEHNEAVSIEKIISWLLAICDGVRFMHEQEPPIVHNNIKPDNIYITHKGTAILMGLGNTKLAADGARTLFFLRHQGSPSYAPSEQYAGGVDTDVRSDIYALGGTLYFMLTMYEPPSKSHREQREQLGYPSLISLQERLANNPPLEEQIGLRILADRKLVFPGATHSHHIAQLSTLPAPLLYQLNSVIERAMAIKPTHRYQCVTDFAKDLNQMLNALPFPSSRISPS